METIFRLINKISDFIVELFAWGSAIFDLIVISFFCAFFLWTGLVSQVDGEEQVKRAIKCGTDLFFASTSSGLPRIAHIHESRPVLDEFFISTEGHFRIHYNITGDQAPSLEDLNENAIPDYVDEAAAAFERSWKVEIDSLGYPEPLSDNNLGGGPEVDVYIQNLTDYYGFTLKDNTTAITSSSWIKIDNDYKESVYASQGLDGLRVTAAHEFFHTIHFSYYGNYSDVDVSWLMEASATWMEDIVYDGINDYLVYLNGFFRDTYKPFTYHSNRYGACVFFHYLAKGFGAGIVKEIWETVAEQQRFSLSIFNTLFENQFDDVLAEFAVWNYFTGNRALPDLFYEEGAYYPYVTIAGNHNEYPAVDSSFTQMLGSRYHRFLPHELWEPDDSLLVTFLPKETGAWKLHLIGYRTQGNSPVWNITNGEFILEDPAIYSWLILIPTCTLTWGNQHDFAYTVDLYPGNVFVDDRSFQPGEFTLLTNFPNPFNTRTTVSFQLPVKAPVKVSVLNLMGQEVITLFDDIAEAGIHTVRFDAGDLSSGIYLITLESGGKQQLRKALLMK